MRCSILLLSLLVSAPASAQDIARLFELRSGGPVRFSADNAKWSRDGSRLLAKGHVRLTRGDATLEADEIEMDRAAGRAVARGNVRIWTGTRAILVRDLALDLASLVTVLRRAEIYVKEGISAEALLAITGRRALRRAARNAITVTGERLLKGPGPSYYIEKGSITSCDCGDDPPSWKITASKLNVDPDDGAWLIDPIFRVGEDGVFGLPALWVPIGDRRTGLLQPQLAYTGVAGWIAREQLFWAVNRSLDFTFGVDWLQGRGFRPSLEANYAVDNGFGRLSGAWINDGLAPGGNRFHIDGYLRQDLAPQVRVSLDLALVSDNYYLAQYFFLLRDRSIEYLPSTLAVEVARGNHAALIAADYFQDLQGGATPYVVDFFSSQRDAAATVHRLPRLRYDFLPTRLGESPVLLSLHAGFTNFYRTGEVLEETDYAGEQARVYRRFDVAVGASAPVELGGVQLTPRLAYRQLFYDAAAPGFPALRGHVVLGGDLAAPFSRIFGAPPTGPAPVGSLKHVLEPVIAYRYVPATWSRGDGITKVLPGLDDLDNLVETQRLYVGLRTRLVEKTGPASYRVPFNARLTQGFDLGGRALADTRLKGTLDFTYFSAGFDVSYAPTPGVLDESLSSITFKDRRGDQIVFSHNYLRGARHERFDLEDVESPLFRGSLARFLLTPPGTLHEIGVSPQIRLPGVPITLGWSLSYSLTLRDILISAYSFKYESPCRCFNLTLQVTQLLGVSSPTVGFLLNLGALGGGGSILPVF